MKQRVLLTYGCTAALLLSACSISPPPSVANQDNLALLQGNAWVATQIGQEILPNAPGQPPATIEFSTKEQRFSGSDSCNRMMGSYQADQTSLRLDQIASTKMACLHQNGLDLKYHQALQQVTQYKISQQQLILQDAQGHTVLTFTRLIEPD